MNRNDINVLHKVCSAATLEALIVLINKYFYSENYIVEDGEVVHSKTGKVVGVVKNSVNKRFAFYQ